MALRRPALPGRVVRLAVTLLGLTVAVGGGIHEALSADPKLTFSQILVVAGTALAAWARRFFIDVDVDELPREWVESLAPPAPRAQRPPASDESSGDAFDAGEGDV